MEAKERNEDKNAIVADNLYRSQCFSPAPIKITVTLAVEHAPPSDKKRQNLNKHKDYKEIIITNLIKMYAFIFYYIALLNLDYTTSVFACVFVLIGYTYYICKEKRH